MSSTAPLMGRGHRTKEPSVLLRDFAVNSVTSASPSPGSQHASRPSGTTPYSIAHFVNCDKFSVPHRAFLAVIDTELEPRSFKEAMEYSGWREAMKKEIGALEDNKTWVTTPLPPSKKALGCKWVYKIKYNSNDSVEHLKAHLVILGNHQVEGIIYYNETFSPIAKMITVRAFLAVAKTRNWEIHQMDVHKRLSSR